jgi:Leucine-rich repeat (LRR) protein
MTDYIKDELELKAFNKPNASVTLSPKIKLNKDLFEYLNSMSIVSLELFVDSLDGAIKYVFTNTNLKELSIKSPYTSTFSEKFNMDVSKIKLIKLIADSIRINIGKSILNYLELTNCIVKLGDISQLPELHNLKRLILLNTYCPAQYITGGTAYQLYRNAEHCTFNNSSIDGIYICTKLTKLDINNEKFKIANILKISTLIELIAYNCIIEDTFTVRHTIKSIKFVGCNITKIDTNIRNLELLEELDFSNNSFQTVPVDLFNLPNLKYLSLANNYIRYLPSNVVDATKLEYLNIRGNEIESLTKQQYKFVSGLPTFISDSITNPIKTYEHMSDKIIELYKAHNIERGDPFKEKPIDHPFVDMEIIERLLDNLEPFKMPNLGLFRAKTKIKILTFIENDNIILTGKINFLMVFIGFSNFTGLPPSNLTKLESSKMLDPYLWLIDSL